MHVEIISHRYNLTRVIVIFFSIFFFFIIALIRSTN